jgi:hypothetical protein
MGRATKGTWGNLGRQKEKEMIIHKWISSDGSELLPTTDVQINLTLPYTSCQCTMRITEVNLPSAYARVWPYPDFFCASLISAQLKGHAVWVYLEGTYGENESETNDYQRSVSLEGRNCPTDRRITTMSVFDLILNGVASPRMEHPCIRLSNDHAHRACQFQIMA